MTAKSDALVKAIADVLRSIPDHDELSRAEIAEVLNGRGIVTGAGQPWNVNRVAIPLRKARSVLTAEADSEARKHPNFGMI